MLWSRATVREETLRRRTEYWHLVAADLGYLCLKARVVFSRTKSDEPSLIEVVRLRYEKNLPAGTEGTVPSWSSRLCAAKSEPN